MAHLLLFTFLTLLLQGQMADKYVFSCRSDEEYEISRGGTIPRELGRCSNFKTLILDYLDLQGAIPCELGHLQNLRRANFERNSLCGIIPSEFGKLTNLKAIIASFNSLSGSIPSELGSLVHLCEFAATRNSLSGSIPNDLGKLDHFASFDAARNVISGSIPNEFGKLVNLQFFWADRNQLIGSIAVLSKWTYIRFLGLGQNLLEGSLPTDVGRLQKCCLDFFLEGNRLEGSLPDKVGHLKFGKLSLNDNSLQGSFASWDVASAFCSDYPDALYVRLERNAFTGSIPSALGKCQRVRRLDFSHNQFQGSIASEMGNAHWSTAAELIGTGNSIQGAVPSELSKLGHGSLIHFGNNRLEGALPRGFLVGLRLFHGNRLSGKLERSLRVDPTDETKEITALVLHGNQLEGSVPTLDFSVFHDSSTAHWAILTLHGNFFSCKLPEHLYYAEDVDELDINTQETLHLEHTSILIGNEFVGPPPPWIPSREDDPILYRNPNRKMVTFHAVLFLLASTAMCLTMWLMFGLEGVRIIVSGSRIPCCCDRWILRALTQNAMLSVCGILPWYIMGSFRYQCSKFPPDFSTLLHRLFEYIVGVCFMLHYFLVYKSVRKHSVESQIGGMRASRSSGAVGACAHILAFAFWTIMTIVLSFPSAFYSLIRSLPKQNVLAMYFGNSLIVLMCRVCPFVASSIQNSCVPFAARAYESRLGFRSRDLKYWSLSICRCFVPMFVIIIVHENCFGLWRLMWSVCSSAEDAATFDVPDVAMLFGLYSLEDSAPTLTSAELCKLPDPLDVVLNGKCGRSIVDIMGSFLAQKLLFEALCFPLIRLCRWYVRSRFLERTDVLRPWLCRVLRNYFARPKWSDLICYHVQLFEIGSWWGHLVPSLQLLILLGYVTNLLIYRGGLLHFSQDLEISGECEYFMAPKGVLIMGFVFSACISIQVSFRIGSLLCLIPLLAFTPFRGGYTRTGRPDAWNEKVVSELELPSLKTTTMTRTTAATTESQRQQQRRTDNHENDDDLQWNFLFPGYGPGREFYDPF